MVEEAQRARQLDEVPPLRTGCILLGFLVGTLIHLSSLGYSYLVTFHGDDSASYSDIVWLSLLWSLLSSSLGVVLLVGVRFLTGVNERAVANMEFLFAVGALNGVAASWLLIDTLLNGRFGGGGQFQVSAITVAFTVVWFRFLTHVLPNDLIDEETNVGSLSTPLLGAEAEKGTVTEQQGAATVVKPMSPFRFRVLGLFCGSIAGLFIQFGSLGANFVLQQILHDNPHKLLLYSLGGSFLCTTMGIGSLLVMRNMVAAAWPRAGFSFLLTLECFFAIGATLGLNAAWTLTDVVLGFQTHVTENLLGLFLTMLWCRVVLCCTSSCDDEQDENDDDMDSEKEELLVV